MKVSLNWIKQFTDVSISTDELVRKIGEQLGAVEEVEQLGDKYQDVYIVKVTDVKSHPDADKLSVCLIDDNGVVNGVSRNSDGLVQVVCGAPNVQKDMLAVWLPPGSTVPSSFASEPFVLDARELRGEISNGMLASSKELAIGTDHAGIVEVDIPADPGSSFAEVYELDDVIIDIENKMFTHRPDCFGMLGVAREIAGITGNSFVSPDWYQKDISIDSPKQPSANLDVKNTIPDMVPRFMAVVLDSLTIRPSPLIIQTYLSRVGIRPINNVVDATNYVMVLTGQPLHAYDADKLEQITGQKDLQLETRLAKKGDRLTLLDERELVFEQSDKTILITSHDIPVGVGGVMGGLATEVDGSTTRIVLECANFDMYAIRRASMKHGLFTDAVTRFNKGQSTRQNSQVLKEATATLEFVAGGSVVSRVCDEGQTAQKSNSIAITSSFVSKRLGLEATTQRIKDVLKAVEFHVTSDSEAMYVMPPFWRTDIHIAEDIVEEIGRLVGYRALPLELPYRSLRPAPKNQLLELQRTIRDTLATAGANEVLTYSFVHSEFLKKNNQDPDKAFTITNALSPDLQHYRLSLVPSLLGKVHANIKSNYDEFVLFEIGKTHITTTHEEDEADSVPKEHERLAFVYASDEKAWLANKSGAAYYQAVVYLEHLCSRLALAYEIIPIDDETDLRNDDVWQLLSAPFALSRSGIVQIDGKPVGIIGELAGSVRKKLKLPISTAACELDIEALLEASARPMYQPLSKYPKISQDITLKLPADISFAEIIGMIAGVLARQEVKSFITPVDVYQPKEDASSKHVSLRITAWSTQKTMRTEELSAVLDEIALTADNQLDAERL